MTAHTCTKHEPGSLGCHRHHGCRCNPCATEARRARKRSSAGLTALTDATPAKAHLERLIAGGHTLCGIATAAGLDPNRVHYVYRHGKRIGRDALAAILAVREPEGYVDSAGTRRRLHALATLGWPLKAVGERLGVGETTVSHWACRPRVATATAAKVARLYAELWDTPGPSQLTRQRAARHGYAPPAAWDDGAGPHGIDNPDATPVGVRTASAIRQRYGHAGEDLIDLIERGATLGGLEAIGHRPAGIERALRRAGRADLWASLRPARLDGRDRESRAA